MEKELKVIEVPASGNSEWNGGAYTIAFVYSKSNGNFILKGYRSEVKKYLETRYTHYFVNYTLWSKYSFRSIWSFWKDGYYITKPDRKKHVLVVMKCLVILYPKQITNGAFVTFQKKTE